jgi:hypothetical protein
MPVPASSRRTLQNRGRLGARAVDPRVDVSQSERSGDRQPMAPTTTQYPSSSCRTVMGGSATPWRCAWRAAG